MFGIQGLGEIEIMSSPQSLVEFNTEVETFCKQNTFQSNFPRHRCEWLTAGPLLQALSTQDGWNASIVRKFFLKFEAAERWVYPEEDIRKLRSCRGNGRRNVLFLMHDVVPKLHHVLNGGTQAMVEVALSLREHSAYFDAQIAVKRKALPFMAEAYPYAYQANVFIGYDDFKDFSIKLSKTEEVEFVVATYFVTLWMSKLMMQHHEEQQRRLKVLYFVQDYEPWFPLSGINKYAARYSYVAMHHSGVRIVSYSSWVRDKIFQEHGVPSYHVDTHASTFRHFAPEYSGQSSGAVYVAELSKLRSQRMQKVKAQQLDVALMLRPDTPRRGLDRSISFIKSLLKLNKRFKESVLKLHTFGCTQEQFDEVTKSQAGINWDQDVSHHGVLNRKEMHEKLKVFDIFVDLSIWQAFGFTALEGMLLGTVPVVPGSSGLSKYIVIHRQTGIVVERTDPKNVDDYVGAVMSLCTNRHLFRVIQGNAMDIARGFGSSRTAKSWETQLFSAELNSGKDGGETCLAQRS